MADEKEVAQRFGLLASELDERMRRLFAAAESQTLGYGGLSAVSRATGVSRRAIAVGMKELKERGRRKSAAAGHVRNRGGGRRKSVAKDATLQSDLERLVDPVTRGDPESPLRWTCKSVRKLAEELRRLNHNVSHTLVAELLQGMDYSLQANSKTIEGGKHPDRNAQFEHISNKVKQYLGERQPVISVDTKKKELVGNFKNGGQELRPKGKPEEVRVHDFKIKELGKVAPYGIYDIGQNTGWVNVGTDHDTATFAVESIRRWWRTMGQPEYPQARRLLITADCGGSNGARLRLWKTELQKLADQTGLEISVCHFPPGTSKWNKIEHRLFSFITQNWRGKPMVNHEVIVNLIAGTTNKGGLRVKTQLDTNTYPKGIKVSKTQFAQVNLTSDTFHGDWNYMIAPMSSLVETLIS